MKQLAYRVGAFPARMFDIQVDANEGGVATTLGRKTDEWPSFVREVWARMYGYDVESLDVVPPHGEWAKRLHDTADEMPEWQRVERYASGDPVFASIGTQMVCEALARTIQAEPPEDVSGAAEILNEAAKGEIKLDPDAKEELELKIWQNVNAAIEIDRELDAKESDIRVALRAACTEAANEMAELEHLVSGFGFGQGRGQMDQKDRSEMLKRLRTDPKLRHLAKLVGRFRMIVGARRARVKAKGNEETVGVTFGHSLPQALPQDLALYLDKRTRNLAYAKAIDGRLLQHERIGMVDMKTSGDGDIVVVIDESASTSWGMTPQSRLPEAGEYSRIDFERAILISLMRIAHEEGRTIAVIHFGSYVRDARIYPKGRMTTAQVLAEVGIFAGGGTNVVDALDAARVLIESNRVVENADVVLLTDADSFPATVDVPAKNIVRSGARLWSFVIASPSANYDVLKAASTELYRVDAETEMDGAMLRMAEVL